MKNKLKIIGCLMVIILSFSGCEQTDVIGNTAKTSFADVVNVIATSVKEEGNDAWSISAIDDSARFIWSKDSSKTKDYDLMLEFDLKPFIDAGLDVGKLPADMISGDQIIIKTELGKDEFQYENDITPEASFEQIVKHYRDATSYHSAMDHFGIDIGDGNKFEWAKDISTNDKDIVFVLDPEVFIGAGADPDKIDGWVYDAVEVMDSRGKMVKVNKLLKAFDIQ